jgi:hypothetical protein
MRRRLEQIVAGRLRVDLQQDVGFFQLPCAARRHRRPLFDQQPRRAGAPRRPVERDAAGLFARTARSPARTDSRAAAGPSRPVARVLALRNFREVVLAAPPDGVERFAARGRQRDFVGLAVLRVRDVEPAAAGDRCVSGRADRPGASACRARGSGSRGPAASPPQQPPLFGVGHQPARGFDGRQPLQADDRRALRYFGTASRSMPSADRLRG